MKRREFIKGLLAIPALVTGTNIKASDNSVKQVKQVFHTGGVVNFEGITSKEQAYNCCLLNSLIREQNQSLLVLTHFGGKLDISSENVTNESFHKAFNEFQEETENNIRTVFELALRNVTK